MIVLFALIFAIDSFAETLKERSSSPGEKYHFHLLENLTEKVKWKVPGGHYPNAIYLEVYEKKLDKKLKRIKNVPFALWLDEKTLLYAVGLGKNDCPEFYVRELWAWNLEKKPKRLDHKWFCGKKPELKDDDLSFPCCDGKVGKTVDIDDL